MSMNFQEALRHFLSACELQKGYSPHTIETYQCALLEFQEYFLAEYGVIPEINAIESADIRPFLGYLHDRGLAKKSIKVKKINKKNKLIKVKEKKFYIKLSQILPYIKKIENKL